MAINFIIIKSDEIHYQVCNHWIHTIVPYNTDVALLSRVLTTLYEISNQITIIKSTIKEIYH